jgi:serine/threonine protein kinase
MTMQIVTELKFEPLREIGAGQGRNSTVYLVNDTQLRGEMVVKVIPKAQFGDPSLYFAEAQALHSSSHPNVVPINYASETPDAVCLGMPFFRNGSLATRIADGPLSPTEVIRVAQGMLAGLAKIHRSGYVHFDLKPTNVLFSDTNIPLVADFGQAQPLDVHGLATLPLMYTMARPPETIGSTPKGSISCDIYHAGLTLYRAVNGDRWFKRQLPTTMPEFLDMVQGGRFPNRERYMPHVPLALRRAINVALSLLPTARYSSATDFADALARVDVKLDWIVTSLPHGAEWRAVRPDRVDLVATWTPEPTGKKWRVNVYTDGAGKRAKRDGCAEGLTERQAMDHLYRFFREAE